jgi:hypothetical protein
VDTLLQERHPYIAAKAMVESVRHLVLDGSGEVHLRVRVDPAHGVPDVAPCAPEERAHVLAVFHAARSDVAAKVLPELRRAYLAPHTRWHAPADLASARAAAQSRAVRHRDAPAPAHFRPAAPRAPRPPRGQSLADLLALPPPGRSAPPPPPGGAAGGAGGWVRAGGAEDLCCFRPGDDGGRWWPPTLDTTFNPLSPSPAAGPAAPKPRSGALQPAPAACAPALGAGAGAAAPRARARGGDSRLWAGELPGRAVDGVRVFVDSHHRLGSGRRHWGALQAGKSAGRVMVVTSEFPEGSARVGGMAISLWARRCGNPLPVRDCVKVPLNGSKGTAAEDVQSLGQWLAAAPAPEAAARPRAQPPRPPRRDASDAGAAGPAGPAARVPGMAEAVARGHALVDGLRGSAFVLKRRQAEEWRGKWKRELAESAPAAAGRLLRALEARLAWRAVLPGFSETRRALLERFAAAADPTAVLEAVDAPPPRTKWTRRVPHPVLIGHAASLSQVDALRSAIDPAFLDAAPDAAFLDAAPDAAAAAAAAPDAAERAPPAAATGAAQAAKMAPTAQRPAVAKGLARGWFLAPPRAGRAAGLRGQVGGARGVSGGAGRSGARAKAAPWQGRCGVCGAR